MNFITYCELPENEGWITQLMWKMKLDSGFDDCELTDAIEEQAGLEGINLTSNLNGDAHEFLANWYDELDYPASGAI